MSLIEIVAIVAMVVYAIYRQTQVSEVTAKGRFKLTMIYGIVGVCVGGFAPPKTGAAVGLLAGSIALSVVVGLARGRLTKLWKEADGRVYKQGTAVTVGLFLGMLAVKFVIGAVESIDHIGTGEGFGEIMVLIAVMVGVQAELVWRRAARQFGLVATPTVAPAAPPAA